MSTVCTLFTMCTMCAMCTATMLLMYSNNNVIVVQQQQVLGATPLDVSVQQCWDCTAKALLLLCESNSGWWSPPHVLPPALLLSVYTNTNQHCCHCTTTTVLVLYSGNRGRAPLPVGPPSCCWSAAAAAVLLLYNISSVVVGVQQCHLGVACASFGASCMPTLLSRSRLCFSPGVMSAWSVRRAAFVLLSWGHVCQHLQAGVVRASLLRSCLCGASCRHRSCFSPGATCASTVKQESFVLLS